MLYKKHKLYMNATIQAEILYRYHIPVDASNKNNKNLFY